MSRHAKHAVSLERASSFDQFTNIDPMLRMAAHWDRIGRVRPVTTGRRGLEVLSYRPGHM